MRVGRLTSDVVLFSIVAVKKLNISQGSVATHLRCDEIFSDSIIIRSSSQGQGHRSKTACMRILLSEGVTSTEMGNRVFVDLCVFCVFNV